MSDSQYPPPPGIPPPIPPGASRIAAAGKFVAGTILACGAGFLLFLTVFRGENKLVSGCAAAQLFYIVPAVVWLIYRRQPAWALGIVFGGAATYLLGSMCASMRF